MLLALAPEGVHLLHVGGACSKTRSSRWNPSCRHKSGGEGGGGDGGGGEGGGEGGGDGGGGEGGGATAVARVEVGMGRHPEPVVPLYSIPCTKFS